jgi:large subunit ribosomal protein L10
MAREEKRKEINTLNALFADSTSVVFTDYRGLSNAEITAFRRKLRESSISLRVVKNTLARIAVSEAGMEYLVESFNGPVAIAYGSGELNEPARAILDYIKKSKLEIGITGGYADGKKLTKEEVAILSKLPSREILLSQILAGMQSPIYKLVATLNAPLQGFACVLQARMKQLEGE